MGSLVPFPPDASKEQVINWIEHYQNIGVIIACSAVGIAMLVGIVLSVILNH